jgi:Secretion system C-terminal sorting domain
MTHKFCLGIVLVALHLTVHAQINITSAELPSAGDTLITQPANLLTDVNLESTGASHFWDFGPTVLAIQPATTALTCYDVNETPLAYQFLFNNPFLYPAHNSEFGLGAESISLTGITLENIYMYYKNSNGKYSITGMGASINGIPLAAHKNEPELIFNTPLDYSDLDTSHSEMSFDVPGFGYYGQVVDRNYQCDGWGTLSIAGLEFEVLRVRTEASGTDSLYSSTFGFGFMLPRPATTEYSWYATEFNVPLLQITVSEGIVTNVVTAPLSLPEGIEEQSNSTIAYPNPANGIIQLITTSHDYLVCDTRGNEVWRNSEVRNPTIDCREWPSGVYQLVDLTNGTTQKIVVIH